MKTSIALKGLLGAGALTLPLMAFAESNVQTGAATASPGATAHVDFSIVIPKILYLRVGTGSTYASGTLTSANTIDLITFSPAAGTVGNGTAVAGTGGDLTGAVLATAGAPATAVPPVLDISSLRQHSTALRHPTIRVPSTDARSYELCAADELQFEAEW